VKIDDKWCEKNAVKPSVILPPHNAPLDLKFSPKKGEDVVVASLHGSWNRNPPDVSKARF